MKNFNSNNTIFRISTEKYPVGIMDSENIFINNQNIIGKSKETLLLLSSSPFHRYINHSTTQQLMLYHKALYLDHVYDLAKQIGLKTKSDQSQYVNWKFTINVYIKGSGTRSSFQAQFKVTTFQLLLTIKIPALYILSCINWL